MIFRLTHNLLAAIVALFLASCANHSKAPSGFGRGNQAAQFNLPSPSHTVAAAASSKPRDRHKMPLYPYSERTRVVRTTAYTHTEQDHLAYGRKNAAGTMLRYGGNVRSAAADWSLYPVGTTFRIKGLPYLYVVDDYGSALVGTGTVDLYKPNHAIMNAWGCRNVELTIVRWGSQLRSAEILKDRVHHPHCAQMFSSIIRQRRDLANLAKR